MALNRLSDYLQGHFWAFPQTRPQLGGTRLFIKPAHLGLQLDTSRQTLLRL